MSHAISHIDDAFKSDIRMLQLAGNTRLENVLELLSTKMNSESYNFLATASASSRSSENRIDRLESLVEKLATQVSTLATDPGKNRYSVDLTCEHCHKRGHTKSRCFKLMTCTKCSKIGHIAKFCTESEHSQPPSTSATETEINSSTTETENVSLPNTPRIVLPISISDQNLEFLYDPGSMFTMIPRATYEKLTKKTALMPYQPLWCWCFKSKI